MGCRKPPAALTADTRWRTRRVQHAPEFPQWTRRRALCAQQSLHSSVSRDESASFEKREPFSRSEAIDANVCDCAGHSASERRAKRLCGILDDDRAMAMSTVDRTIDISQTAAEVCRNDCECVAVDDGFE